VLGLHAHKMFGQRALQRHRQHRHPILPALAVADGQFAAIQIDVFHAQLDALHQPQADDDDIVYPRTTRGTGSQGAPGLGRYRAPPPTPRDNAAEGSTIKKGGQEAADRSTWPT
jgi:hypothetical protein